ncbi:MAG: hypothetical protein ACYTFY_09500 [Planctomycetota bacterium]|jgi:hypothetical protein
MKYIKNEKAVKNTFAHKLFSLIFIILFLSTVMPAAAAEKPEGIMLLSSLKSLPRRPEHLLQHGIPIFVVDEEFLNKTVGEEVETDLAKCNVLVVERGGSKTATVFFNESRYRKAVKSLLMRGGILFIDFGTNMSSSQLKNFLKSIKVNNPGYAPKNTLRSYSPVFTAKALEILGSIPNKISNQSLVEYGAYGAFKGDFSDFTVIAEMKGAPGGAAMLMKENVLGKGKVFFSQVTKVWKKLERAKYFDFQENLISYLIGKNIKKSGPGENLSVSYTYKRAEPEANSLYLSQTKTVGWWKSAYKTRIPVLVAEPIGKTRQDAPVSVVIDGDNADARIVTHYGEEIVSQKIQDVKGKTRYVFLMNLKPYEHRLLFIYLDGPAAEASAIEQGLQVILKDDAVVLKNDAVKAGLMRNKAALSSLEMTRDSLGSAVAGWGGIDSDFAMLPHMRVKEWEAAEILSRGPVQAAVRYKAKGKPGEVTAALYAGNNPYIVLTMNAPEERLSLHSKWTPGGRADDFDIVYRADSEIKKIASRVIGGTDFGFRMENLSPFMRENWFAVQAPGRETVGVCMGNSSLQKVYLDRTMTEGVVNKIVLQNKGSKTFTFRVVLDKGDWTTTHKNYIEFTNPPVVYYGNTEKQADLKVAMPVPHRDYCRIIYLREKYMNPSLRFASPEEAKVKAGKLVRHALKWGANVMRLRMSGAAAPTTIALWEEVRTLSKKYGLATFGPFLPEKPFTKAERAQYDDRGRPCPVKYREDHYNRYWRDSSKTTAKYGGCEEVHILDEYRFINNTDEGKALFKKRYGGELPPAFPAKFNDQSYADSLLFRMNIINELNRDLAQIIRKSLPDVTVTSVVNLKGLNRLWRISDLEEQSRYLDMPGIDLYSAESYYRKIVMFTRGAYDNKTQVENCIGYDTLQGVKRQLNLSTVYGTGMLNFGGADTLLISPQKMQDAVGPHFVWMQMSGLSQLFSEMKPLKYAALLRDTNFFKKSIKNMELPSDMKAFTLERGLLSLADLHNLKTNMVFSRFFKLEALKGYKLLIVPDNKYLSEEFARTIKDFAEQGGCVYVEGKSCTANSVIKKLCSNGKPLAEIAGAKLFTASAGKGRVIYTNEFLSERLPSLLDAKMQLTALLRKHAGTAQVELKTTAMTGLDHIVYTDGERYLVNIINLELFTGQDVQITCNVPGSDKFIWTDLRTGAGGDFNGSLDLKLGPDSARYILLAPAAKAELPKIINVSQSEGGYALNAAMKFLKPGKAVKKVKKRSSDGRPAIGVYVYPAMNDDNRAMAIGHRGLRDEFMKKSKEFNVAEINSLDADTISQYDMIVVPNIRKTSPPPGWEKNVREFAVKGGRVMLFHHAAGFQKVKPSFPEVGRGVGYNAERTVNIIKEHPVITGKDLANGIETLKKGDSFESSFPDYISLAVGPAGEILAQGIKEGRQPDNVVIVGSVNEGKAALFGINFGCDFKTTEKGYTAEPGLSEAEQAILWNTTRWLLK